MVGAALATPGLPTIAWAPPSLPFNPSDYDPKTFAQKQFDRWSNTAMQAGIENGRAKLSEQLHIVLPKLPSLGHSEIADWTTSYVMQNGVPTNIEGGAKMVTALAHAQASKLGVPPEWIAAADFMVHPPTSVEEGFAMVANVGKAYWDKYGAPLLQNELLSLSANLNMVAQAIPVQFAIAGFDALKDGKLSAEEITGIAVQAASYACGLLLQSVGIPAPLGALMAGVIAQGLTQVADDVIHRDDSQTRARKAAYDALEAQRQALMSQCAKAAENTWNKTQEYWDQVLAPIQSLLDVPQIATRLQASGGLRYFGRNVVTLPPGVILPETPSALAKLYRGGDDLVAQAKQADADAKVLEKQCNTQSANVQRHGGHVPDPGLCGRASQARRKANSLAQEAKRQATLPLYQYGFDCMWWEGTLASYNDSRGVFQQALPPNAKPFPDGCLYYGRVEPAGVWGPTQQLEPAQWAQAPYWVDPTRSWDRCGSRGYKYPSFWSPDTEAGCAATLKAAANFKYDSATLGYETRKMEVRLTPYNDHHSAVRTKWVNITRGAMVDGKVNAQAALQFWGATRQATVHSSYSAYADSSDAAQWKQFAYIDPNAMSVYTIDGKLSANLNLPFNYCDVNQWSDAVQIASAASALVQQDIIRTVAWQVGAEQAAKIAADWKALAALTPEKQAQLVTYAKAVQQQKEDLQKIAALSPEQQRQLVAYAQQQADLRKIAALTPDQQRELVAYAQLAALTPAQQQQLVAYATALKAKQRSDMVAQRVRMARLQAKALGAARASKGAYAAALKARLRHQTGRATAQMVQKTSLIVGGVALGAFLLWKVATRRK
jgi:hypothetical protein